MSRNRTKGNEKKAHHFVPITYLNEFTNENGSLRIYQKEAPNKEIWRKPINTGFRNYYYSQPTPEGTWDNNTLEDHFSEYEDKWPDFVSKIRARISVNENLDFLFQYIMLQNSRVPATRDMVELILAQDVVQTVRLMDRNGMLPPKPEGLEGILDNAIATIDPHMSIHAMSKIAEGLTKLLQMLGLAIIRNQTGTSFFTSDNPIIWFDPSVPENKMRPHTVSPEGPVLFFFPLARDLAILGSSEAKDFSEELGLYEGQQATPDFVNTMNRLVAKFSYQAFYSDSDEYSDLAVEFSSTSPTIEFENYPTQDGTLRFYRRVFGPRRKPHKWSG